MEVELKVDDITAAHKAALKGKLELLSLKANSNMTQFIFEQKNESENLTIN